MRLHRPLLGINFFAGDVSAGLGPYLAIYLLTTLHWSPGQIGVALALGGIATVLAQTPAGAIIDVTRAKRGILAVCIVTIAAGTVSIIFFNSAIAIYAAQIALGAAMAFMGPSIAALTLGIVGRENFTAQTSANQAVNHAGNVVAAVVAAGLALWVSSLGVFWLVAAMATGMLVCVAMLRPDEIDHDVARGLDEEGDNRPDRTKPSGFATLIEDRRLLVFAICVVLFHFANAAMLPLVGQKLALNGDAAHGIAFTSACIVAAQVMMTAMALFCGWKADSWGRKPLFLIAFSVLPIRGVLFTLWDNSAYLVAVQALDGVANGIFAMLFLLIIADITAGTGRFNLAQGALATLVGIGASCSNLIAEWVVQLAGYSAGFLFLAFVAVVGSLVFAIFMPETAPHAVRRHAKLPMEQAPT
ncbi:MFS transporter [Hoeflea poritis]|uniref:MFS transporter n=1 Tax=Hoeflea poritis TaxID=2993659 RepID=A0ABT4VRW9_9HYPH|nr:MFS transporter [Hoeflea poritis]MDA4847424.1 MFS transporter [Hoeflea poritis]